MLTWCFGSFAEISNLSIFFLIFYNFTFSIISIKAFFILRCRGGKMSKDAFEPMMMIKYMKSLVQPGEAVGLLAAQVGNRTSITLH